jgi:hypothetical protein
MNRKRAALAQGHSIFVNVTSISHPGKPSISFSWSVIDLFYVQGRSRFSEIIQQVPPKSFHRCAKKSIHILHPEIESGNYSFEL